MVAPAAWSRATSTSTCSRCRASMWPPIEQLPFPSRDFHAVECDAVLEHVRDPVKVMAEDLPRARAGGYAHLVTPFCHPFHEYPKTIGASRLDGLEGAGFAHGSGCGGLAHRATATMLVMTLEYAKLLLPFRAWRVAAHGILGWVLFPLRYLDLRCSRTGCGTYRQSLLPVAAKASGLTECTIFIPNNW